MLEKLGKLLVGCASEQTEVPMQNGHLHSNGVHHLHSNGVHYGHQHHDHHLHGQDPHLNGKKRVAIIGGGPSGMAQVRAFKLYADKDPKFHHNWEVICYEKQKRWGGLWNYSPLTGTDEHGEPLHNGMYRHLWMNAPKEKDEMPDYPWDEYFGKAVSSYLPRPVMWDFLNARMLRANANDWFRFNHSVQMVTYNDHKRRFHVVVWDKTHDVYHHEHFDYVIVCSGHFSTPRMFEIEGSRTFPGRILHSHDFRDARGYIGQNVICVGNGYSAEDIACQCYKFGAKSATISYHSHPTLGKDKWPLDGRVEERPMLVKLEGRKAIFKDGSCKEDIDAVILCSGYLLHYPFLEPRLRLVSQNRFWPGESGRALYKGVQFEANKQLFYIGMQDQVHSFSMFNIQAFYIRELILRRLPSATPAQMSAYFEKWRAKELALRTLEDKIWYQTEYVREIIDENPECPAFDIEGYANVYMQWKDEKKHGLLLFRDFPHRSLVTGTLSVPHHTKWAEIQDDSAEDFLKHQ